MTMRSLLRNIKAATMMEFALVAPVLMIFVIGIAQLGIVGFASAGLHNAVAQGARRATLHPRPTAAQVLASVNAAKFGLDAAKLATPVVTYNTTASPNFADVEMSYTTDLNFVVYQAPITLTRTRRVYLQTLPAT